MPISSQEAAQALDEIAQTQRRASILRGYEKGAPHFFLWGLIWIVGYAVSDLSPELSGLVWLLLDAVGITGSYLLGRATVAGIPTARQGYGPRFAALGATLFAFMVATYFVMRPHEVAQFGAFPALLVATIYTVVGIWRGSRWAASGIALGICTIAGIAVFKEHYMLWMAVAGGSTLLISGFWLRQA